MKDYYQILGVPPDAFQEEIKGVYRRLAYKHHPDTGDGNEARLKDINEAYEVLSDKEKRDQYDKVRPKTAERKEPRINNTIQFSWQCTRCGHSYDKLFCKGCGGLIVINEGLVQCSLCKARINSISCRCGDKETKEKSEPTEEALQEFGFEVKINLNILGDRAEFNIPQIIMNHLNIKPGCGLICTLVSLKDSQGRIISGEKRDILAQAHGTDTGYAVIVSPQLISLGFSHSRSFLFSSLYINLNNLLGVYAYIRIKKIIRN
ncbi:MAG: hypothetical protein A2Z78_00805 [Candidatus Nealsonbacteria bacterium RBG_13_36_15]|uniref:J domain-containing protein n=1 Tax=Candidatus Nealsonbacteria bacterium RBG_13_36_15 TaxID=1801660 RepID=A0A1G2DUX7_9BACT|nr:MAG: hypothetical protein A2Z78_00805 [Candidatus Nealsonbacteria bacterium RBG_13_36_15]